MVDDFQHNVSEILDIKELVVEQLVNAPELVNEIFSTAGSKEFPFIVRSGFYFGFLFGLPTMLLWYFYQAWWIFAIRWAACGLCHQLDCYQDYFRTQTPKKTGADYYSRYVFKAPKEVSEVYSNIIEEKLITPKNITHVILHGSGSAQLLELIELHVNDAIERYGVASATVFCVGCGVRKLP